MRIILVFYFLLVLTSILGQSHDGHTHLENIKNEAQLLGKVRYQGPSSKSSFVENKGQWPSDVLFRASFRGGNLWVQKKKLVFHLQDFSELHASHMNFKDTISKIRTKNHVVHINFENAISYSHISKGTPYEDYQNYFIGNDSSKWVGGVQSFSDITIHGIYNGVDLRLIQEDEQLKYEYHIAPGVDPSVIQLSIAGQNDLKIDELQRLKINTPLGTIIEEIPFVYQNIGGVKSEVKSSFILKNSNVSFQLGKYDQQKELIIDPVLVFATYSGSKADNFGMTATYGHDGSAYTGGTVFGIGYPIPDSSAFDITTNFTAVENLNSASDVFISKYSKDGKKMLWTSFLGGGTPGAGAETIHSLICDSLNNIYAFGVTSSTDFPITSNAFQQQHRGGKNFNVIYNGALFGRQGTDIYIAKMSANGHHLIGSTYLGGSENDGVNFNVSSGSYNSVAAYDSLTSNYGDQFRGEIMIDSNNNVIVATSTRSKDFPIINGVYSNLLGEQDGVIFKLKHDFSSLLFSTYIGGSKNDALYSVKLDSSYNIVFCGGTSSLDLPTTSNVFQPQYGGGKADGFVGKLNNSGNTIQSLTYIGLNNYDQTFMLEINQDDEVYLIGHSLGGNFPITNATYSVPRSTQFIAQLDKNLSNLLQSTVYGSGDPNLINISPSAFLVDICGNVYVSGWGANILQSQPLFNMPVTPDAFLASSPNGFDFHLFVLDRGFDAVKYATFMGGNQSDEHVDGGTSRFDKNGVVYQSVCAGCWGRSDFPFPTDMDVWSKYNLSTKCNNLVFKFDFQLIPSAKINVIEDTTCAPARIVYKNKSVSFDKFYWKFSENEIDSVSMEVSKKYLVGGDYTTTLFVKSDICKLTDQVIYKLKIVDSVSLDPFPLLEYCDVQSIQFTPNSNGSAKKFHWSSSGLFQDSINPIDSTLRVTFTPPIKYYLKASNGLCSKTDSLIVSRLVDSLSLISDSVFCSPTALVTGGLTKKRPNFNYSWEPINQIIQHKGTDSVVVNSNYKGLIYLTVSASNGCFFKDSIFVRSSDSLVITTPKVIEVCTPKILSLKASSNIYKSQFTWSFSPNYKDTIQSSFDSILPSLEIKKDSLIFVTALRGDCIDKDTVQIILLENRLKIIKDTLLCSPQLLPLSTVFKSDISHFDYQWLPKDSIFTQQDSMNVTVFPKTSQYFTLHVKNPSCDLKDSVFIDLSKVLSLEKLKPLEYCAPKNLVFSPQTNGNFTKFTWASDTQFKFVLQESNTPTFAYKVLKDNILYYKISNSSCEKIDSVFIRILSSKYDLIGDTINCKNALDTLQFKFRKSAAQSFVYDWQPASLISSLNDSVVLIRPEKSGYFYVTVKGANNCIISDSIYVNVLSDVQLTPIGLVEICQAEKFKIILNSLGTANNYQWFKDREKKVLISTSSDSIVELFSPVNSKFYYTATNGECKFEDSIQLNIIQQNIKIIGKSSLCYKTLDTLKAFVESYKQFYSFDWFPKSSIKEILSDTTVLIYPKNEGYIYVVGTGVGNQVVPCTVKDSIKITLQQNKLLDFKISASKTKVMKGGEVSLSVPPDLGVYTWSPNDHLTNASNHLVTAKIFEPSVFSVVLNSKDGCIVYDTILIDLAELQCEFPFVFVPNAFSPNNDNENDVLYVRGGIVKEILFRIYNRWGEKVFESTSLDHGWDGTFKGELLAPDVYDYYLLVECVGGLKNQLQGNVTLIR